MNRLMVLQPHIEPLTQPWNPSPPAERSRSLPSALDGSVDAATWPSTDLYESFASSGGSWSCETALELIRQTSGQAISKLARWIVEGRVVRFEHHHRWFVPVFQFSLPELTPRPVVQSVVAELRGAFDEQEIVSWFASPNSWLGGARPAEVLSRQTTSAIQAAQADRYIASGD